MTALDVDTTILDALDFEIPCTGYPYTNPECAQPAVGLSQVVCRKCGNRRSWKPRSVTCHQSIQPWLRTSKAVCGDCKADGAVWAETKWETPL